MSVQIGTKLAGLVFLWTRGEVDSAFDSRPKGHEFETHAWCLFMVKPPQFVWAHKLDANNSACLSSLFVPNSWYTLKAWGGI